MRYRLSTLLIAMAVVPTLIAIFTIGGAAVSVAITINLICIVLVKRYLLADDATWFRNDQLKTTLYKLRPVLIVLAFVPLLLMIIGLLVFWWNGVIFTDPAILRAIENARSASP
jgi:hypothetical protein